MKKAFKFYTIIWVIILALFFIVTFCIHPIFSGYIIKYDSRFWTAFIFIVITFIGNLACAYYAFKADNHKKVFFNLPLLIVSWATLITLIIVGSVLMLIPNCPAWITAVVCIVILAFNAIAIAKAVWVADTVNDVEEKVKVQTSFIKNLTVNIETIISNAKSDAVKIECQKIYEAVRYSDPVSNSELSLIEAQITTKFGELASAVRVNDAYEVKEIADDIIALVTDRNKKCNLLK